MDFLGPIVQILLSLWDPISRQIGYCKDLNHNMATLKRETEELKCKHDEVEAQVEAALSAGKIRLLAVQNWLQDSAAAVADVQSIRLEVERGRSGCCCLGLNSRRGLGKRVIRKISDVEKLRGKGDFSVVAESPRRGQMPDQMQVPRELEQQRSSKEALEEISHWLKNDGEVHVICVWGMGGVGKTTLVKEIYNKVNATKEFQQVIWVTVSKDLDLQVIQKAIGSKLELKFDGTEGIEEKRNRLYARLRNVRYLLILDDLWCEFSLDQVGIPQPNKENHCKIVITTRFNDVSNAMEADRQIKIKPLRKEEAWDLFRSKTDNVVLLPEIRPLAEKVVKKCGGLPLAITTVGRAMRRRDKKELWEHALRALKGACPEIRGMECQVFLPLKLSYDWLEDPIVQSCFLYCSLYPEDWQTVATDLTTGWAFEEGLVNNVGSLEEAINKGHDILEKLIDSCLLEESWNSVMMHDLLRDLAIWITSPSSAPLSQASKFMVKAGEGLEQPPAENLWEGMERISLMHNQITELQMVPNCPYLVSLWLGENLRLHTIHNSFFELMPKLQVLELYHTSIKSLPSSLSQLVNLRVLNLCFCRELQYLPPLGDLTELQVLVLSHSGIENLPQSMASLAKLKFLGLRKMNALTEVPKNIISELVSLEHLELSLKEWETSLDIWREVAALPRLSTLHILFPSFNACTANVIEHPIWSRMSRFFVVFGLYEELPRSSRLVKKEVHIISCQDFTSHINSNSMFRKAEELRIEKSKGLECLSHIVGNSTTSLRFIKLEEVKDMKCVVDWRNGDKSNSLECLEKLFVQNLPFLEKVFVGRPHTGFQQLREIYIDSCPKLTFIFSSAMLQLMHQLKELTIYDCEEIEEIVEGGELSDTAPKQLLYLCLEKLPKLVTIFSQHLVLTSVERIEIEGCPKLKRLPVLCSSHIQEINGYVRGSREWWEGIQWADEHSKSLYFAIYEAKESSA